MAQARAFSADDSPRRVPAPRDPSADSPVTSGVTNVTRQSRNRSQTTPSGTGRSGSVKNTDPGSGPETGVYESDSPEQDRAELKRKEWRRNLILAAIGFLLFAGTLVLVRYQNSQTPYDRARAVAETAARRHLADELIAPSTMEFLGEHLGVIEKENFNGGTETVWFVTGKLDAQNAAGVPVRYRWGVAVRETPKGLRATMVSLDGWPVWSASDSEFQEDSH